MRDCGVYRITSSQSHPLSHSVFFSSFQRRLWHVDGLSFHNVVPQYVERTISSSEFQRLQTQMANLSAVAESRGGACVWEKNIVVLTCSCVVLTCSLSFQMCRFWQAECEAGERAVTEETIGGEGDGIGSCAFRGRIVVARRSLVVVLLRPVWMSGW